MMRELLTHIRFLIFRKKQNEFDEELRFHLEQSIAVKVAEGLPVAEARRQALIEFGAVEAARQECERQRPGWWLGTVAQDIRYAVRGILAHRWFSVAIMTTLALGIGLNTMVFTLVNAVLYKPVSVPGGDRLVSIMGRNLTGGDRSLPFSYPDFRDDGYLLDYPYHNRLCFGSFMRDSAHICFKLFKLCRVSLGFGVIAIVIALAFTGKIYALPSSFAQEAGACNWKAELSPAAFSENVNIVSPAEDNNVVLPVGELFALNGSWWSRDRIPVHFLHLGVIDTAVREKHPCFYPVMRTGVATAHPLNLGGGDIVQYLHTGINVNTFGDSLASVGSADMGTQRQAWVNNYGRVRFFCLIHKINSEPSSFVGLRCAELLKVNDHSQSGDYEQKNISKELKPFYPSRLMGLGVEFTLSVFAQRTIGLLFLAGAAICFLYAQIIPLWRFRRKPIVGIAIGIVLLVIGFLFVAQFYNLVLN